jgi:hypothetical protein
MTNNQCSKQFPKQFCSETTVPQDGYPIYRRRSPENGGISFVAESGITIDNRWVVPYNPYLTLKFNAHINVEICNTVQVLKYLLKYVYSGHDKTSAALEKTINPNERINECKVGVRDRVRVRVMFLPFHFSKSTYRSDETNVNEIIFNNFAFTLIC